MASQAKITSFYRNAKQSNSLAAKRRKAVISEAVETSNPSVKSEAHQSENHGFINEDKSKETTLAPEKSKFEPTESITDATTSFKFSASSSNISFTASASTKEETKKKPPIRKARKSTKSKEPSMISTILKPKIKHEKALELPTEQYKDEITSVDDNHGCSPEIKEPLTPKQPNDNSTSCRKRKMESNAQETQKAQITPVKLEKEIEKEKTPTKVRKRLEMGVSTGSSSTSLPTNSPAKQVQFICMGTLSPAKMQKNQSPFKSPKTVLPTPETAQATKSPAVKSLASLLDKAAPPKLTPEEIKSRLGKSRNLSELQAKLRKVSDCSAKVKEFQNQIQLRKFSSLEFNLEVPVSPHKSPLKQSPIKRDVEKRPAFERFHALAQPPSATLVLPFKYKVLAEVFRCLETVVIMLYNRKESIYFSKLKPAVQKMLQRDFTEKHLAQICYVFPTAYTLSQEKPLVNHQNSPYKPNGYQLTLIPNLNYLTSELFNDGSSAASDSNNQGNKIFQPMGPTMLVERRYIFHNRLVKIVKEHHGEFLAACHPNLIVPDHKLTRWHQNFDVDGVPDVPAASLPQPPEVKSFHTAKDVLEHAHKMVIVNPRLEAALKARAALFQDKEPESTPVPEKPAPVPENTALKGVSQSLIEKIRAREAAKAQKQMTMDPKEIRRQEMVKILPEIARIISSIFITEKKGVLPLRPLIERIQYSYNGVVNASDVEEYVRLLHSIIPDWLTVLNRSNIDYVKVNRGIDSNIVYQKLEDHAKV